MKNIFSNYNDQEYIDFIRQKKIEFGKELIIPAHHYQNIEIAKLGDILGDSYKLAVESSKTNAKYIVFCGVKFMVEGAKILAKDYQNVIIPDMMAGCPMADMIDINLATKALDKIKQVFNKKIAPVVYMNSYADMKHFCGINEGAVCTSSNAKKIVEYYLNKNYSVFFFPDYNLGINTAKLLGIENETVKINKNLDILGETKEPKMMIWDGFCHVHKTFTLSDINNLREKYNGIKIIVHPECDKEVVDNSDISGSTEQIYRSVKESPDGTVWSIGTELNFVKRMADEFSKKTIVPLRCSPCINMQKITLKKLAISLQSITDNINAGTDLKYEVPDVIDYKDGAKIALQKMIEIVEGN